MSKTYTWYKNNLTYVTDTKTCELAEFELVYRQRYLINFKEWDFQTFESNSLSLFPNNLLLLLLLKKLGIFSTAMLLFVKFLSGIIPMRTTCWLGNCDTWSCSEPISITLRRAPLVRVRMIFKEKLFWLVVQFIISCD